MEPSRDERFEAWLNDQTIMARAKVALAMNTSQLGALPIDVLEEAYAYLPVCADPEEFLAEPLAFSLNYAEMTCAIRLAQAILQKRAQP